MSEHSKMHPFILLKHSFLAKHSWLGHQLGCSFVFSECRLEPPQIQQESVSNPRRNRKFKDFDGTLSSFNRFSTLNLLAKLPSSNDKLNKTYI